MVVTNGALTTFETAKPSMAEDIMWACNTSGRNDLARLSNALVLRLAFPTRPNSGIVATSTRWAASRASYEPPELTNTT